MEEKGRKEGGWEKGGKKIEGGGVRGLQVRRRMREGWEEFEGWREGGKEGRENE